MPARIVLGRTANARCLAAISIVALIVCLTMYSAIRRGMDHAVMIGPGDQTAIAISLSRSVYGLNLGYIGHKKVFDTIHGYWNRDAAGWGDLEKLKANFHDRELLNAGIRAAASLGPLQPGYISDGSLITTYYDDMGEVDYVTIAFMLLGKRIESLFYLYFALLALSGVVFVMTFQDRVFALAVVLTTLFAYYVELYLKFFEPIALSTYWGMRHSSTLCLVPTLHLAFLLLWKKKLSPAAAIGAAVQLFILILAWRIRGSVTWAMVFLPSLAFVLALVRVWPRNVEKRPHSWPGTAYLAALIRSMATVILSWRMLARETLRWPLVLLLVGIFANNLYNRATLHPIYDTDDILAYHGLWHSVHLGLALYAPDVISPRVLKILQTEGMSDDITVWSSRDYLDKIHLIPWNGRPEFTPPAPGFLSPWHGIGLRQAWHDRILRDSYIEMFRENPARMLRMYAAMPLQVLRVLASPFSGAPSLAWLWLAIAAGVGVFVLLLGSAQQASAREGAEALSVVAAAIATATLPNLVSYVAAYAMPDSILLIISFISAGVGISAYAMARRVQERRRTRAASAAVPQ